MCILVKVKEQYCEIHGVFSPFYKGEGKNPPEISQYCSFYQPFLRQNMRQKKKVAGKKSQWQVNF